ncbi:DEBR0S5_12134g1_1 [Brettanomyces bruxellensis]|uniref:DEBR0S5_12134g1_1 n=1 Tax=Dekkera bruxellensis TaxID=5007 RepID=A0A7D9D2V9_DEKBR|nr:DEBR0S5_12134g1_1 [Brettanomyces bruxellensis]
MTASYVIAGRRIPSHYLAMATLATTFGGIYLYTHLSKSKKTEKKAPVKVEAGKDDDIMKNIDDFLKSAEQEQKD